MKKFRIYAQMAGLTIAFIAKQTVLIAKITLLIPVVIITKYLKI